MAGPLKSRLGVQLGQSGPRKAVWLAWLKRVPEKQSFRERVKCFCPCVCSIQQRRHTNPLALIFSPFFFLSFFQSHTSNGHMWFTGNHRSPPLHLSHPFKKNCAWVRITFIRGTQLVPRRLPISLSNYKQIFFPPRFLNTKLRTTWNKLKLMKAVWSFVTDGREEKDESASFSPLSTDLWSRYCHQNPELQLQCMSLS